MNYLQIVSFDVYRCVVIFEFFINFFVLDYDVVIKNNV